MSQRRVWRAKSVESTGANVSEDSVMEVQASQPLTGSKPQLWQLNKLVGTSGLMGLKMNNYSKWYNMLEINSTFHRRGREDLTQLAKEIYDCHGLQAVVKVSIVATHENRLHGAESWWPSLWKSYAKLHEYGILAALLWQCPPSLACNESTLEDLICLCRILKRTTGGVRHVFDFRHSSWYSEKKVVQVLRQHGFCLAWLHLCNDNHWAGDLMSGWSTDVKTADFVYLRLFGSKGRSIGKYPESFLREEVLQRLETLPQNSSAFVVFGQGDVPMQALENAWETSQLVNRCSFPATTNEVLEESQKDNSCSALRVVKTDAHYDDSVELSGTVTWVEDGRIFVDIGNGQEAELGARHVGGGRRLHANMSKGKRQGRMRFHAGERLTGLQVEHVDAQTGQVFLSATKNPIRSNLSGSAADRKWIPVEAPLKAPVDSEPTAENDLRSDDRSESSSEGEGECLDLNSIPRPAELGANPERQLTIITWGKSRGVEQPDVQIHISCDFKKFHYLTRNNKHIKKLNGLHEVVQSRICRNGFFESWLREAVGRIEREDIASLSLHCHKGTHLSVAIAEIMRKVYYPDASVKHLTLQYIRPGHVGGPARH